MQPDIAAERLRLQRRNVWLRRAYGLLQRRRRATLWLVRDLNGARRSIKCDRDRLSLQVTDLTIQGIVLEVQLRELEDEQDRLHDAARQLVAAAKAWTAAHQTLTSPDVRQRVVSALADAIDAFDPMLSETTAAAQTDAAASAPEQR